MTEDRWSIKEREDKMTKHFDLELDLGGRHMEDKDLDQLVAQLNDIWISVLVIIPKSRQELNIVVC